MVSVCLPSDAILQHLPSYLGCLTLDVGVSLHGCSSKAQQLLLTLDEGYLLTATVPDLQRGIAPLGPPGGSFHLPSLASGARWLLLTAGGCESRPTKRGREKLPTSEVRGGGREETPRLPGQWRPRGDTLRPRSGRCPGGATLRPRSGAADVRLGERHLS